MWIEGVPPEEMVQGMWHVDGLPASLRSVLKFRGVEDQYVDDVVLAALTGQPFRFWFSSDWASCLAYTFEEPLGVIVAEALGFDFAWRQGVSLDFDAMDVWQGRQTLPDGVVELAWREVRHELEAGNPVIVYGADAVPDLKAGPATITGYDDENGLVFYLPHATWRPAPAWDEDDPECAGGISEEGYRARGRPDETNWIGTGYAPGEGMGGSAISFFALRERTRVPTEREVAVAVLSRAVGLGRGNLIDERSRFRRSGIEALNLLGECLEDGHRGESGWREIGGGDWWFSIECLTAGGFRCAAAAFLARCADGFGEFGERERAPLAEAAEAYARSGERMTRLWRAFESVGPLGEYDDRSRTVGEALSSSEFRGGAAQIVRSIVQAEEDAIRLMERALRGARVEGARGKLVLKGFPSRSDYHVRGFAELLALQDCASYLGVENAWAEVLGFSGDAFGCDGMMDLSHVRSHDVLLAGAVNLGFDAQWVINQDGETTRQALHDALAGGRPAIVCGFKISPSIDDGSYCREWNVVIGEDREAGRYLITHGPDDHAWALDGSVKGWSGTVPWANRAAGCAPGDDASHYWNGRPTFIVTGRHSRLSAAQRFTSALRNAVSVHRSPPVELLGVWGEDARRVTGRDYLAQWPAEMRRWSGLLRGELADFERSRHEVRGGAHPLELCYFSLVAHSERRDCAAAFLRRHAGEMPPEAGDRIMAAAEHYVMSAGLSEKVFSGLAGAGAVRAADWRERLRLGPDTLDYGRSDPDLDFVRPRQELTVEDRETRTAIVKRVQERLSDEATAEAGSFLLGRCLGIEDAAIAEIEEALRIVSG